MSGLPERLFLWAWLKTCPQIIHLPRRIPAELQGHDWRIWYSDRAWRIPLPKATLVRQKRMRKPPRTP